MTRKLLIFINIFLIHLAGLFAAPSVTLNIPSNGVTVKGSTVQISCLITDYSLTQAAVLYKMSAADALPGAAQFYCTSTTCGTFTTLPTRYTYSRNSTGMYLTISDVRRDTDQAWWRCLLDVGTISSNVEQLIVYSSPGSVAFQSPPTAAQDLGSSAVTLTCVTADCADPAANFAWYYMEGTTRQVYRASTAGQVVSNSGCSSPENKFSSTLSLPRYTTFTGNSPKTTTFQCGVTHPALSTEKYTGSSVSITFAVRVTSVTLRDGTNTVMEGAEIRAELGTSKSLNVEWFPASSNPSPTVTCYLGSTPTVLSGSVFTFTVQEQSHGDDIRCTATNSNNPAVSTVTARLFVLIPLTALSLYNNGAVVGTGTEVRVENGTPHSLTLGLTPTNTRPSPNISCFIGSTGIPNAVQGSNFTLTPRNTDHGKELYCRAGTIETSRGRLYVVVGVSTLSITNTSLIMLDGRTSTATCVTGSATRPAADVSWEIEGTSLTNVTNHVSNVDTDMFSVTSSVSLAVVKAYNGQQLVCKARVGSQQYVTDRQQVTVWYAAAKPTVQPDVRFPWLEGQPRQLTCPTSDPGNPSSSAVWHHTTHGQVSDQRLVFHNVTSVENGMMLSCERRNNFTVLTGETSVSDTVTLNVEYSPRIQIISGGTGVGASFTTTEGSQVSIECRASGNPTPSTISWRTRNSAELIFQDVNRTEAGDYQCDATARSAVHGQLSSSKQLHLIVQYAPDIRVAIQDSPSLEGGRVTVLCDPHGLPASYTYIRFEHTWQEMHIRNLPGNRTLILPSVSLQDSGVYTCVAENSIVGRNNRREQEGSASLQIRGPPKIIPRGSLKFSGEPGKSASISIPYYSDPALSSLRVYHGDNEIRNSSQVTISHHASNVSTRFYDVEVEVQGFSATLIFRNITVNQFANYTIRLQNEVETVTETLEFVASSEPLVPEYLVVTQSSSDGVIMIQWQHGFNGGHPQTFIAQYRQSAREPWVTAVTVEEDDPQHRLANGTYIANITGLPPGTYTLRLFASNSKGNSTALERSDIVIVSKDNGQETSLPVAAIGGGVGAALLVIVVVIAVLFLLRRYKRGKDANSDGIHLSKDSKGDDEDVIVINDIYDGRPVVRTHNQTTSSGAMDNECTYADVRKKKKNDTSPIAGLYAEVSKTKKTKGQSHVPEAVYENPLNNTPESDGTVYENHEQAVKKKPIQKKMENELSYVQVEFAKPKIRGKKVVIHGLEDRTGYAEIAFGKVGERLPDSDEEDSPKPASK